MPDPEPPTTSSRIGAHAPFVAGAALYAALLARDLAATAAWAGGAVRYGCDDAYIHLAFAKQFAATGVWGVTGGEFAHASSSPLWTLLLAGIFRLAGPVAAAPLVLNVLASLGVLWLLHAAMRRRGVAVPVASLATCLVVVAVPLPWMTMLGMEHVLQLLADLVLGLLVVEMLGGDAPSRRLTAIACAAGAAAVATRLEGAFLVGTASALLLGRGRWREGSLLSACGAAPVVLAGLVAMSHGWGFLPTSVALKGTMPSFATPRGIVEALGGHGLVNWMSSATLVAVTLLTVAAAGCAASGRRGRPRSAVPLLVLTSVTVLAQCQFAGIERRYVGYLAGLGVAGVALTWPELPEAARQPFAARVAWAAGLAQLAVSGALVEAVTPLTVRNIHDQQGQLARFFADDGGGAVALNDIGAVAYSTSAPIVDLFGLATREVAEAKLAGAYTSERMDAICRAKGVRVAAIYDAWFDGTRYPPPPATWTRAGTWTLADNVGCGSAVVTFYSVAPGEAEALRARLAAFAPGLPSGVESKLR